MKAGKKMGVIKYRNDIDGLRAIAVMAVIFCHLGFLPNGYLGVDIFFTISGYLITAIVYKEASNKQFSVVNFYLRRIRRIIPLVIFTTSIALIIGFFFLLPYDLKSLSQSVLGTNFFLNNVVQYITSASYWDLSNDYKPLMHTWSLAVEEQFYMFFPLLFLMLKGEKIKFIVPVLSILTLISFVYFFISSDENSKFYLIQYRFYELSIGGIAAIVFGNNKFNSYSSIIFLIFIILLLLFKFSVSSDFQLVLIVISSVGLLVTGTNSSTITKALLQNKLILFIGKISFSLYMWHQIILAYGRYVFYENIGFVEGGVLLLVTFLLSVITYYYIEQIFRNKEKIGTRYLLYILLFLTITTSGVSFYLFHIKGIIKDVPELGIYKGDKKQSVKFNGIDYNGNIFNYDKPFADNKKIRVLIIGNSYARDFSNILLESKLISNIDLSYTKDIYTCKDIQTRINEADHVFFSTLDRNVFEAYKKSFSIDETKVWNVGMKNFGANNGVFYNKTRNENYYFQRVSIKQAMLEENKLHALAWGEKYIDLLTPLIDRRGKMPVFTPNHKFISHDGLHLTKDGAMYYADILDLDRIFLK